MGTFRRFTIRLAPYFILSLSHKRLTQSSHASCFLWQVSPLMDVYMAGCELNSTVFYIWRFTPKNVRTCDARFPTDPTVSLVRTTKLIWCNLTTITSGGWDFVTFLRSWRHVLTTTVAATDIFASFTTPQLYKTGNSVYCSKPSWLLSTSEACIL